MVYADSQGNCVPSSHRCQARQKKNQAWNNNSARDALRLRPQNDVVRGELRVRAVERLDAQPELLRRL